MDSVYIDGVKVTPASMVIYEELIKMELLQSEENSVFPQKQNTLSYAFQKDGISMGYYKILSSDASETQGLKLLYLHKQ